MSMESVQTGTQQIAAQPLLLQAPPLPTELAQPQPAPEATVAAPPLHPEAPQWVVVAVECQAGGLELSPQYLPPLAMVLGEEGMVHNRTALGMLIRCRTGATIPTCTVSTTPPLRLATRLVALEVRLLLPPRSL